MTFSSRSLFLCIMVYLLFSAFAFAQDQETLVVVTHDSFSVSEEVLAQFEASTGVRVQILRAGDAGQMVNQSILTKNNPLGDVLFGVDNTFLGRALDADLFVPYESLLLAEVDTAFIVDEQHRVTPVDYGDVCLNYDVAYFAENDLPLPQTLRDLIDPIYRGLLVVQNPATSSPGLAFLLATIAEFGEEGEYTYTDFWIDLMANEVLITPGWSEAYFGYFTAGSEDGTYPLVVSYASSPPFTVDEESGKAATASLVADGMCFRQIEFAGILAGTPREETARLFIDFLLDVPFQEDLPFQMYVFPVNPAAELPDLFVEFATVPENPVVMDVALIDAGRAEWIQTWTEIALR